MSSKLFLLLLLTILLQQSSQLWLENCNITIHESKESGSRCKSRLKRASSRTLYYSNSIASFNITLSGDVEKKAGPGLNSKCTECNKTVNKNHKRLICSYVKTWYMENAVNNKTFSQCKLVWHNIVHVVTVFSMNFPSKIQIYKNWIKVLNLMTNRMPTQSYYNPKSLSIAHLNTHPMFLHIYYFDIMTLSETWLKNNKHMLEYVQVDGYNSEFINRGGRKSGGVGV